MENEKKTVKERIYELLVDAGELSVGQIMTRGDYGGRTYVSRVLAQLRDEGRVLVRKEGRNVWYSVAKDWVALDEDVILTEVGEDEVWRKIRQSAGFVEHVPEKAEGILQFAFTEMLNNAIDHSKSGVGHVKLWREGEEVKFIVRDKGVGVFRNVMAKRGLADETAAIQELVKGKVTTAPKWHSGEGIFWTSKIADRFELASYGWRLLVDNELGDYAIEKLDAGLLGTEVRFVIGADTEKSLHELFGRFALNRENYSFDTTLIPVKLFETGEVWISRSQAKRVLEGLDKYKRIVFDFKGIELVGQAFADEIFRVFRRNHPEVVLEPINMNEAVRMMVERAMNDETWG
ncbi:DUF4325 domain-containing protein [Candidatus Saccharibacteria bacterium]|nr:DUF4325 domain-containing protein [Candidatus Saccharibacteria bacterium]